ncbi:carbohydrate ABC transporter permease [Paenibacillus tepidiphilus]|uniref:carbohydrate ABC transporter permease n=1 Tax=Paenibacillus tepidiphilus TaxID=2608683 RepID=UPI00123A478D|nr:carbohydrate ABC transporter permease [Paenibacillus tepidiphilus]
MQSYKIAAPAASKRGKGLNRRPRLWSGAADTRLHPALRAVNGLLLILLSLTMILPIWNSLIISLSGSLASMQPGLRFLPADFSLEGYQRVWSRMALWRPFMNNVIVTFAGTLLHVLLCSMAGYTLMIRFFPFKRLLVGFLFVTMTVPSEAILIPLYIVNKELGLLNTLSALVLSGIVSGFSILLMASFFRSVPYEMQESARIDGAGDLRILFRIYMPLAASGIATVTLFEFVSRWNQFTPALLYISDSSKYTLQIALRSLIILSDSTSGSDVTTPNVRMAGVMIAILPLLAIYPFVQRYFVQGLTAGAMKE